MIWEVTSSRASSPHQPRTIELDCNGREIDFVDGTEWFPDCVYYVRTRVMPDPMSCCCKNERPSCNTSFGANKLSTSIKQSSFLLLATETILLDNHNLYILHSEKPL